MGEYSDALQRLRELEACPPPETSSARAKARHTHQIWDCKRKLQEIGCPSRNQRNTEWLVFIADHFDEVKEFLDRGRNFPGREDDEFYKLLEAANVPTKYSLLSSLYQLLAITRLMHH